MKTTAVIAAFVACLVGAAISSVGARAETVAATMLSAPRSFLGRTAIGAAIDFAMERVAAAPAQADKRIIDISGDGTSNSGRPVTEARDDAVAAGATINALAIINTQA